MFGRRRGAQAGTIESLRAEMRSAHRELRTLVADTVSTVEGSFRVAVESQERAASAVVAAVDSMRADLGARDLELGNALRRVVEACDTLVERVRADAAERSALVDAVVRLAVGTSKAIGVGPDGTAGASGGASTGDAVIGGSVIPPAAADGEPGPEIRLRDGPVDDGPLRARLGVQCRFGHRWVDGFEILEVVQHEDGLRCTVRRLADGYVLPTLFGPEDIRPSLAAGQRRPLVLHAPPRRVSGML
ncbi:MAG: hypothetical protein U0V73_06055 [Acidimicrobiia bacterium]